MSIGPHTPGRRQPHQQQSDPGRIDGSAFDFATGLPWQDVQEDREHWAMEQAELAADHGRLVPLEVW